MKTPGKAHPCRCSCHDQGGHAHQPCDRCCDAHGCGPSRQPTCPPPEHCPFPGTVELPQQEPPPKVKTAPQRPETVGRPPLGSAGEIPWFRGQLGGILRDGPTFGPRKDEFLPFLFVRANAGDSGARPLNDVFWESPDIYVVPGQEASTAPLQPASTGGVARANGPNTLYAHVWNLGKAPAYRVRVEFYWFNPSLGISRADANFIGATWVDLGNRFNNATEWREVDGPSGRYLSHGCHAIVKCPETWVPSVVNGGHECLVVRVHEPMLDAVPPDQFSAAADRHVAQRNIAVVPSASPAAIDLALQLGYVGQPGNAEVEAVLDAPDAMQWLKLYTGRADPGLQLPANPVSYGLSPAVVAESRLQQLAALPFELRQGLLQRVEKVRRGCDPQAIPFHASIADIKRGEAAVLRVRQRMNGTVVGGYTVVLIGS
ncbi:hypothetical protein NX774_13670 [Massilia agilis]|uniref:Uncharacterized protein n=1 Tax=Massilia agilis TaxID=1811226 RepID=A0ABT2DCX1_9BURK|nr:hypothetical protein [Massilia agilis]MCS0808973.1 hypothetical protein [Massilia agilis]